MLSHPDYIENVKAPAGIAPDDGWADLERDMEASFRAETKRRKEAAAAQWENTAKNPLLFASAVNGKQKAEPAETETVDVMSSFPHMHLDVPFETPKKGGWADVVKCVCAVLMIFGGAIMGYAGLNTGVSAVIVCGGVALGMSMGK